MVMHKVDAKMEAGEPPDQGIIAGMGALVGESIKAGVMLDGAGLHRSAARTRLKAGRGERSLERGPYGGSNELVASVAMIKAMSMEDALGVAERFVETMGEGEVEIGPVVEAWDLGMMPKPDVPGGRFLLLCKGDAKTEAGDSPSPEQRAALTSKDKPRTWVDGPFAESKELIAGFSILELPSLAEALAWADRYAAILGDNEVDVRLLEG
jgi:hypothetical protein